MTIKLLVTRERYMQVMDVDTALLLTECTDRQIYEKLLEFVVDDEGKYVGRQEARKRFAKVPLSELSEHVMHFVRAVTEAFVNPTKEGGSRSQSDPPSEGSQSDPPQAGSPS